MLKPTATPSAAPAARPTSQCRLLPICSSNRATDALGTRSWFAPRGGAFSGTSATLAESALTRIPLTQAPGAAIVCSRTRAPIGSVSSCGSAAAWAAGSAADWARAPLGGTPRITVRTNARFVPMSPSAG